MAIARLSEIDLAKALALQPGPALELALQNYNKAVVTWGYSPARASICDVVAARSPLFGAMAPTWEQIERQVRAASQRGETQTRSNLQVSRELYDTCRARGWRAAQEPMGSLSIGFGDSVRYWSDLVLEDENGPFVPFFDHRRGGGITRAETRRIVFSMQNIGVRDRNPDLFGVRLAIITFPVHGDSRSATIHFHNERELLGYDEMNRRVQIVYATWARVSEDRVTDIRRRAGGRNPLGV